MNLIKVEQIEVNDHYQPHTTMANVLQQIFNEAINYRIINDVIYHGVRFNAMSGEGGHIPPLKGIQMSIGHYGNKTIRKVMVKNDMIDADAIKFKFAELELEVKNLQERADKEAEYRSQTIKLRDKIAKMVNPDREWDSKIELLEKTPDSVLLITSVNGTQLRAIEQLLGEQTVEVKLTVPETLAVQVYNIAKGVQ